MTSSD